MKKAQLINYYGPTFAVLCQKRIPKFTVDCLLNMLCTNKPIVVGSSNKYADDFWYKKNDGKRHWKINRGWQYINRKSFSGQIVGGNLETLLALSGTQYLPQFKNCVLFLEEANAKSDVIIRREIQQLKLMGILADVEAIIFGRFWGWSQEHQQIFFENLLKTVLIDFDKPLIYNFDFGHSDPMLTIPIGGYITFNDESATITKECICDRYK